MRTHPAVDGTRPTPIHLLAGSPGSRRNVYGPLVADLLGRPGKARPLVAYLGAATDDDPRFLGWMQELVTSAGPCTFRLAPVAGRQASGGAAREIIEAADLVFVGGGDVELGMQRVQERDLAEPLRRKHAGGAPVFGISAGAIMLGSRWIRWRDPDDDDSAELFDCLGLAPILCDCHGEADGWGELKALLKLAGGRALGHGLRAGAAVRVGPDGAVEPTRGAVDRFRVRGGKVVAL